MGNLVNQIPILVSAKEVRDKKRYAQKEIAEATGLSESYVSRLMNSDSIDNMTIGKLRLMANWLECSLEDLYELESEKTG